MERSWRSSPLALWHDPQQYAAAPGLEVSPGNVLKDLFVQTQFGNQPLQLAVLLLQFLQPLGLAKSQIL